MMKKAALAMLLAVGATVTGLAQSDRLSLQAETRIDYQREYIDGDAVHPASGFKGKYLNVKMDGKVTDNLTFSYRQRLNKAHADQSFFDATDWIHLDWKVSDSWALSAGKQVVGIGGYEYDRAPIDLYFCSEYWGNIPCYQLGASASYTFNQGRDRLMGQVCESPFSRVGQVAGVATGNHTDMYAYNLMWYGTHGWLNTIYSVNIMEYMPGKYISYIALGNRFEMGKAALELDLMNRAADGQTYFLKDCSVMAELSVRPTDKLNVFAKVTYDVNNTDRMTDLCVLPGTEETIVGCGVEYYPLKDNKNLRLHAVGSYVFGSNSNPDGAMMPKQTMVDVGLKWRVKIL